MVYSNQSLLAIFEENVHSQDVELKRFLCATFPLKSLALNNDLLKVMTVEIGELELLNQDSKLDKREIFHAGVY